MYAEHTQNQRTFSDVVASRRSFEEIDYKGSPVHEHIRDLPMRRLFDLLHRANVSLDGKRVLIVGCGIGTDIYYLSRYADAKIYCTDISPENVSITRKFFPSAEVEVADTEALPYPDGHFDFAIVCDSLHHMARPYLGIYEMLRVSKDGICIIEPHDCLLTRVAMRVGLMQEYEDAGNYVLTFSGHDLTRLVKSLRLRTCTASLFATDFGLFERMPQVLRRLLFPVFRIGTACLNRIVPGQGNVFVGAVFKQ
jgi:SAM-dependent methyltransferase